MRKVAVLGLGYIGLPTAAVLAMRGYQVHGVDVSESVVTTLNSGSIHIVEPGLDITVTAAINSGALKVGNQVEGADIFILAVPTPLSADHQPDLSYIRAAVDAIAPHLKEGNLVILESTIPVGTTNQLSQWLAELRPDLLFPHALGNACNINIAHCPERVLPGKVLEELIKNHRVIGGISTECTRAAVALYSSFVEGQCLPTTAATAEMAKLTENAFRDVNIAFANELSVLADEQNVDIWELIALANHHPRVDVLQPGPGVGGHCIAVDPWFLVAGSPENARLIKQARIINDEKSDYVIAKVEAALKEVARPVVACLGLSFKANVDDLRESPAMGISAHLANLPGVYIKVVEPHIEQLPESLSTYVNVEFCDISKAIAESDVVLLLVDHSTFSGIPHEFDLTGKQVIDTRGLWRGKP